MWDTEKLKKTVLELNEIHDIVRVLVSPIAFNERGDLADTELRREI